MSTFKKIKVLGADLNEFSLYVDGDYSLNEKGKIKTVIAAEELGKFIEEKVTGKPVALAKEMGEGHYIVLSARSADANAYSVSFEGGNVYLRGNYISIDNAVKAFSDMLQNKDELGESDGIEGSLGFKAPYTKEQLLRVFKECYEDGYRTIIGFHATGTWLNGQQIQQSRDACEKNAGGHCAGILELDMGIHSVYNRKHRGVDTLSELDLSMMVSESAKFINDGGIVSVCVHMSNPLMNGDAFYMGTLGSEEVFDDMLTDGTALNKALRKTLEPTFRLIKAFKDNGLPFMFRPLHEMNGDWFWWCENQRNGEIISAEMMHRMWKYFYKMVVDELGVDNALWVYSPNIVGEYMANKDILYSYPGDEYVDIVGCDWYPNGYKNGFDITNNSSYKDLMSTGKPCALTEFGPGWTEASQYAIFDEDGNFSHFIYNGYTILDILNWMRVSGLKVAYFLNWTGCCAANMKYAEDLFEHDATWGLSELSEYWKSLEN